MDSESSAPRPGPMGPVDHDQMVEDIRRSWTYIKEGNASLVIGRKADHMVYRMWKCDASLPVKENCRQVECQRKQDYVNKVLKPLLGQFVGKMECVPVSAEFVDAVSKAFQSERPDKRLQKIVDPSQRFIISQPNFCFIHKNNISTHGSNLTIEIKPKQGFIPVIQNSCVEHSVKASVCYHCRYQELKMKLGTWDHRSRYCPINLFSGNESKMRQAIEGLFCTPQNNFCILRDASQIYPENGKSPPSLQEQQKLVETLQSWFGNDLSNSASQPFSPKEWVKCSSIQKLISLIIQILCHRDENGTQIHQIGDALLPWQPCLESQPDGVKDDGIDTKLQYTLRKGCVLDRILEAQLIDTYGIECIHRIYERYKKFMAEQPEDSPGLSLDDPRAPDYLGRTVATDGYQNSDVSQIPIEVCVAVLRRYLVSRTARDCSIMITLQCVNCEDQSVSLDDVVSVGDRRFHFSCKLVDLDAKSPSKIPQYHELDQRIVKAYMDR